jgi:hypothetical protein
LIPLFDFFQRRAARKRPRKLDGVNAPIRVGLKNPCPTKTLEGFCIDKLSPLLRKPKREPKRSPNVLRKGKQIVVGPTNPEEGFFALLFICHIMPFLA